MKEKRHSKSFLRNFIKPIINVSNIKHAIPKYINYIKDRKKYSRMNYAEEMSLTNSIPTLFDDLVKTPFDSHYFYQDIWAFKKILELGSDSHLKIIQFIQFHVFMWRNI